MEQVWIHFEARRRELYLGTELLAKIETAIKHPCTICKQEMELSTPANAGTGIHSNCFVPWYWKEWAIDIIAGVL